MLSDFREFIARGNVVDIAVGIAVGTAFAAIARSLVTDIIMPPVGLFLNGVDFQDLFWVLRPGTPPGPYETIAEAQAAGAVTVNYGTFINTIISFLIIALAFFFIVRTVNRLKRREEVAPAEPTDKVCPYCRLMVPSAATRCPQCTSELESAV